MSTITKATTANTDFTRGNNADYVHQLCEWSDVIMLQEAKDMVLKQCLPDGWAACHNTDNDAKAGSAIGVDKSVWQVRDWWLVYGCPPPPQGGMLTRYICVAVLEHKQTGLVWAAMSAHEPPQRYAGMQPEYPANLKAAKQAQKDQGRRVIVGADANMPIGDLADKIGGKGYGHGIIGCVTGQPVTECTFRGWGPDHNVTDHPAVTCKVDLSA